VRTEAVSGPAVTSTQTSATVFRLDAVQGGFSGMIAATALRCSGQSRAYRRGRGGRDRARAFSIGATSWTLRNSGTRLGTLRRWTCSAGLGPDAPLGRRDHEALLREGFMQDQGGDIPRLAVLGDRHHHRGQPIATGKCREVGHAAWRPPRRACGSAAGWPPRGEVRGEGAMVPACPPRRSYTTRAGGRIATVSCRAAICCGHVRTGRGKQGPRVQRGRTGPLRLDAKAGQADVVFR